MHGLFADGSCWTEVIARLRAAGLNVTSVQNPLTTLDDAVAEARRVLDRQDGPTVLAGHSFSGMIVTEAGVDPKVSALVYVAARAPDAARTIRSLPRRTRPRPPPRALPLTAMKDGSPRPPFCAILRATYLRRRRRSFMRSSSLSTKRC